VDQPALHSQVASFYRADTLPPESLVRALLLHVRTGHADAAHAIAARLATEPRHDQREACIGALREYSDQLLADHKTAVALQPWGMIPAGSDLHPQAAVHYAQYLLWWTADFAKAVDVLRPLAEARTNAALRRVYAQALILNQQRGPGQELLEQLPIQGPPERHAAMSGAMARSIEHYIGQREWQTGEEHWERWQTQYPGDFLHGYSVLLRVRLMESRGWTEAASRVAEAFAKSVPDSTYAPMLLDTASKLAGASDPARSTALRQLLRQRYPEDPLSQGLPPAPAGEQVAPR
jgi:hypothetical protein